MLKKDTISKIATLLKIKVADLETALTATTEADITIAEDLQVLTTAELESRDNNQKNEGIKAGKEIGIKEVRKAAGLEDTAGKDPAKIAELITEKAIADAKMKPDEKVKQLTDQVGLLQRQLGEKDTEVNTYKTKASEIQLDRKLLAAFPKNRTSTLTDDEYLTLIKTQVTIEDVDGKTVVKKGGEVMRDSKTQNPLELSAAIGTVFTERKGWLEEASGGEGGRGGGDGRAKGVFINMTELKASFEKEGKSVQGAEFQTKLQEVVKANPEFNMNE